MTSKTAFPGTRDLPIALSADYGLRENEIAAMGAYKKGRSAGIVIPSKAHSANFIFCKNTIHGTVYRGKIGTAQASFDENRKFFVN